MNLADNLRQLEERIGRACDLAGRDRGTVRLVAVTKTVHIDLVRQAYDLGLRDFGESRLQEALPKLEALPKDICWHFIGPLQSNKAKRVAQNFDWIHTLDSPSQVREIGKQDRVVNGLIEVNLAREPQKSGIMPEALDEYLSICTNCSRVRVRGLMTVGPMLEPDLVRPFFAELRTLLVKVDGGCELSMGMSGDFESVIQEGSTMIRIGSSLFGARA